MAYIEFPATEVENPLLVNLKGITGIQFFEKVIPNLITLMFVIASVGFFFMFIIGAIKWITSGGDKAQTESARGTITSAVTGLFLTFIVFAVVKVIEIFFGVDILTIDIDKLIIK